LVRSRLPAVGSPARRSLKPAPRKGSRAARSETLFPLAGQCGGGGGRHTMAQFAPPRASPFLRRKLAAPDYATIAALTEQQSIISQFKRRRSSIFNLLFTYCAISALTRGAARRKRKRRGRERSGSSRNWRRSLPRRRPQLSAPNTLGSAGSFCSIRPNQRLKPDTLAAQVGARAQRRGFASQGGGRT